MVWNHETVYDALVKKENYEKSGKLDKYVSLDQMRMMRLNSILYRHDARYIRAPIHINKKRTSFSEELFERISPAIEKVGPGSHGWNTYRVIDWGKLAEALGLEIEHETKYTITEFRVGNFKAFADTQKIPIRPITLIFGPNSGGKSSIIHSLALVHEADRTGELDVFHTQIGGSSIELGGFLQYVHRHQTNEYVEWGLTFDANRLGGRLPKIFDSVRSIAINLTIGMLKQKTGTVLPSITSYELKTDDNTFLRMNRQFEEYYTLDDFNPNNPILKKIFKESAQSKTTHESFRIDDQRELTKIIDEIRTSLRGVPGLFLPEGIEDYDKRGSDEISSKEDITNALRIPILHQLNDMIRRLNHVVQIELNHLQYLGPLRSYPPRHFGVTKQKDENWYAGGGYAWDIVLKNRNVRETVNTWLKSSDRLKTPYELIVRRFIPLINARDALSDGLAIFLGWLRKERWRMETKNEEFEDISHGDFGRLDLVTEQGMNIWDAAAPPELLDRAPEEETGKPRDILLDFLTEKLLEEDKVGGFNEVVLIDRNRKTEVSHHDVGIGVSQVLPVLVSAYGSKNRIIAIEQPEIHLHPALQAELGDVFIESALGERGNTFILETHSEHILLRLMRRMRQTSTGTLKNPSLALQPKDIMVLYVEPDGTRSIIREMPLNEQGELVKAWPGGFFEEGLREVF